MDKADKPTAKVLFCIPEDDGSANTETLWAFDLGDDNYRLDNCPFYAYDVSAGDTVYAPISQDEGRATFEHVVSRSGNRTVRFVFESAVKSDNKILQDLVQLGCSFEGANSVYFSLNIPPNVELATITEYLTGCEANWEYADPSYERLHANGA